MLKAMKYGMRDQAKPCGLLPHEQGECFELVKRCLAAFESKPRRARLRFDEFTHFSQCPQRLPGGANAAKNLPPFNKGERAEPDRKEVAERSPN
jgi:hypothetical protein